MGTEYTRVIRNKSVTNRKAIGQNRKHWMPRFPLIVIARVFLGTISFERIIVASLPELSIAPSKSVNKSNTRISLIVTFDVYRSKRRLNVIGCFQLFRVTTEINRNASCLNLSRIIFTISSPIVLLRGTLSKVHGTDLHSMYIRTN